MRNPRIQKCSELRKILLPVSLLLSVVSFVFGQTPNDVRFYELKPNQAVEREMSGAETHHYKFDLKAGEFFQARVEQKGVDVLLQLTDANVKVLAKMDSPNGKEGFETLTFVAANDGSFILEVISSDDKAEKGNYLIKREESRKANDKDIQQVEIEKNFVEGLASVIELNNEYQKANAILQENFTKPEKSKADATSARIKFKEALSIFRSIKPKVEDESLKTKISRFGGKESRQLLVLLRNIAIYTELNETLTLGRIAQTHYYVGEWNEYVEYKKLTVIASQNFLKFKNDLENSASEKKMLFAVRSSMAQDLDNIGSALYTHFGQLEEAIKYSEHAVELYQTLYQETQDGNYKIKEAMALANIGFSYDNQSKYKAKAIEYFTKSLEIFRAIPTAKSKVAEFISLIGSAHMSLYDYISARKSLEESLEIYRELNDKQGQANILNGFAVMYLSLNNQSKFKEYIKQTLDILESPDYEENTKKTFLSNANSILSISNYNGTQEESLDNLLKRTRLQKIAFCYELLKDYKKSLEYNKQALGVSRSSKEPDAIRSSLRDVAFLFAKLQRWNEAVNYYQQALKVSRQTQDRESIASDLQNLGWTLLEAGKYTDALQYQNEALITYQSVGVDENKSFSITYSTLLNEISRTHYALGNKRLAILYGKRAVNAIQGERQRLQSLDPVSQKGFLENKEKHYRRLADWLIAEGRITEAEQVLAMLKDEEVSAYLRRDVSEAEKLQKRTDLKPEERDALTRYHEIADRIAAIGAEYDKLRDLQQKGVKLTGAQQMRYDELSKQVKDANNIFQVFLKQLAEEFASRKYTAAGLDEDLALQSQLKDWGAGVVFLYTLVGEDRYRVILTTAKVKTDGKSEIKAVDLDKKISDFRQIVQNPKLDPRPLGRQLYDILIKPIEKQLEGAQAKTLIWSLDGNLRLLPLAALWDGKQYFGQKYQNVIFTVASRSRLNEASSPNWRVLGLGVSESKTVSLTETDGTTRSIAFSELPAVKRELSKIVADKNSGEGVLPGFILLNSAFNKKNFTDQLINGYKAVHIASHFDLNAGDATQSFLLLGDGNALTVSEIKTDPNVDFAGVDLLALSACQTAVVEKDSNGKEIEGFGYVAQQKGAKAILATLWSVADESTAVLMGEFYRLRKVNPKLSKSEAIQLAQKQMIEGKLQPLTEEGKRRAEIVGASESKTNAPPFPFDKSKPFAHPYYWSPFILIGNWR